MLPPGIRMEATLYRESSIFDFSARSAARLAVFPQWAVKSTVGLKKDPKEL
jgi:hypothetical protein